MRVKIEILKFEIHWKETGTIGRMLNVCPSNSI